MVVVKDLVELLDQKTNIRIVEDGKYLMETCVGSNALKVYEEREVTNLIPLQFTRIIGNVKGVQINIKGDGKE